MMGYYEFLHVSSSLVALRRFETRIYLMKGILPVLGLVMSIYYDQKMFLWLYELWGASWSYILEAHLYLDIACGD